MARNLTDIEGIGEASSGKLAAAGISTVEALLVAGAAPKGRKEIESTSGLSGKLILRWVNMADLFRIKGVGEEYADLLESAGVDTVPELAQRNAVNLHTKMQQINDRQHRVRAVPGLSTVEGWVEQAKALPRRISH